MSRSFQYDFLGFFFFHVKLLLLLLFVCVHTCACVHVHVCMYHGTRVEVWGQLFDFNTLLTPKSRCSDLWSKCLPAKPSCQPSLVFVILQSRRMNGVSVWWNQQLLSFLVLLKRYLVFVFYFMCMCFSCMHICMPQVGQKRAWIPWNCGWVWITMWVLGTDLGSSGIAAAELSFQPLSCFVEWPWCVALSSCSKCLFAFCISGGGRHIDFCLILEMVAWGVTRLCQGQKCEP